MYCCTDRLIYNIFNDKLLICMVWKFKICTTYLEKTEQKPPRLVSPIFKTTEARLCCESPHLPLSWGLNHLAHQFRIVQIPLNRSIQFTKLTKWIEANLWSLTVRGTDEPGRSWLTRLKASRRRDCAVLLLRTHFKIEPFDQLWRKRKKSLQMRC